jgi:ribosomal protein S18 acetylase RimI-like enzyme
MDFREISLIDYPDLVVFWRENYFVNEMDNPERFKLFLEKNPSLSIMALDNKIIVGTVLGSFDGRRGYIQKLVVGKEFRNNGIGKQLVDRMITKLKSLGVTYIPLAIEPDKLGFYEKCGFMKSGQVAVNINL